MAKNLPVRFKQSLPRGFQFPTRGRTLSPALEELPCFEHLTLGFYLFPEAAAQARAGSSPGGGTPLPLLRATVLRLGEELGDLAGETWELSVFAVPKVVLAAAQAALTTEGLPKLHAWLRKAGQPSTAAGIGSRSLLSGPQRRTFELRFEPKSSQLRAVSSP